MGRSARISFAGLPPELDAFLDMLVAERGAAANTLQAYRRDLADTAGWLAANRGAGLVAATALVSIVVAHLQAPQPQPEVFMRIPYVVPAAPYERTAVVRMNVPAAALIAAGLEVRSPAEDSLAADVLVGQDGRALAVSLVSDSGEANR